MQPTIPSPTYPDLATIGGRLGPEPEDFVVSEVPAYVHSGEGEHLYVRVRKCGRTTRDLIRAISRASNVRDREIGCAGQKDKHAVTDQWFSLPAREAGEPSAWELPDWAELLETARHGNKLRTGHLRGNRFSIRLVDVPNLADVQSRLAPLCAALGSRGFLNVFDAQRFGYDGRNLDEAVAWLGGRSVGDRRLRNMLASAVQSEIFNRYAIARTRLGLDSLFEGEVVRLSGSSSVFVVEDVRAEQPRFQAGDLHLTGPMHGPKMRAAFGLAAELEAEAAAAFPPQALQRLEREAPGTRRDLLVKPEQLAWQRGDSEQLHLSFFLPSGSYATRLLAELTGDSVTRSNPSND